MWQRRKLPGLKRAQENKPAVVQTLVTKVVMSMLVLTACLGGTTIGVAGQSMVSSSAKYSALPNSGVENHFVLVENLRVNQGLLQHPAAHERFSKQ